MQATQLQTFAFQSAQSVRVLTIEDEPWFVAADVAELLDYRDASNMCRRLDDDEKGTRPVSTLGGTQRMLVVNESGFYCAILASHKPDARRVRKWVTSEVLPQIRQTGSYAPKPRVDFLSLSHRKQLDESIRNAAGKMRLGSKDSAQRWIINDLRVRFSVDNLDCIAADKAAEAIGIVNSKRAAIHELNTFIAELQHWFNRQVLGGGQPWTPKIKAELTRELRSRFIPAPSVKWDMVPQSGASGSLANARQ